MIIRDHINMMPNPLIGPNNEDFGTRFTDKTRAYEREYIRYVEEIASSRSITLKKNIYIISYNQRPQSDMLCGRFYVLFTHKDTRHNMRV